MPLYIAQSGDLVRCHGCLTDRQTLKDRATQLLIKYKSGALVTQCWLWFSGFSKQNSMKLRNYSKSMANITSLSQSICSFMSSQSSAKGYFRKVLFDFYCICLYWHL